MVTDGASARAHACAGLLKRALGIQASQKLQAILYNSPHLCFILVSPIDQPINIANGGR
jgi:hypothetical protein